MECPCAPETIDQLRERIKELEIEVRVLRSVLPQPYYVPYTYTYPQPYWYTQGTGTLPDPYPYTITSVGDPPGTVGEGGSTGNPYPSNNV